MRGLEEVTKEAAKVLKRLGIEYVIVGGVAVAGWGNIRTTRDVDVILSLKVKDVKKIVRAFKDRGFSVGENDILAALKEESHFTIFDKNSEYHIDAKGVYGENERRALKRRRKVSLKGIDVYIASPEDIIVNKLLVGGEQDLKDAEGIYIRQLGKLDMRYLKETCREAGVQKELAKLVSRVKVASLK
jgi:predicted nucleotidyltransferase